MIGIKPDLMPYNNIKCIKILLTVFICAFSQSILSQKVTVQVVKIKNVAESEWLILNEQFNPVFRDTEYFPDDSIPFSLESNRRYQLEISVSAVHKSDTVLYKLYLNGKLILLINSNIDPGDHFYYFYTGVPSEENKITGGTSADISNFPWQVYLQSGQFACGGSIISGNWIITAAHCTVDDLGNPIPAASMVVVVGANNPAGSLQSQRYSVSQVIANENFNHVTLANDIALLKVSRTITNTNATPVKLVSGNDDAKGLTDPGVLAYVTGYGLINVSPPTFPTSLQKVQLPIVSDAQARVVWPVIPSTDLMAGYLNGGRDACSGDSGGPLVVPYFNGFKLGGIVSWGSSNCDTYGGYTRVSLFESWISSKTGIEISFTPPAPAGDSIVCQGISSSNYSVGTVPGATSYEWQLFPSSAGTISVNAGQSSVSWNQSFTGKVYVMLRVIHNNSLSDWSLRNVHIAKNTRILSQSKDTILCAQKQLAIKVSADGYNLNYSWYRNDTLVQSGASNEVNLTSTSVKNTGSYISKITGSCGSATSLPVNLTVWPLTGITSLTPDSEVAFNGAIALNVTSVGHDLRYQWSKDSIPLYNVTGPAFVVQNADAGNTGLYQVSVKGTCGTVLSRNVYVYVKKKDYSGEPEVFVWPTLISNQFNVALSNDEYFNLLLFTTNGRLLKEITRCRYVTPVNTEHLPPGLYIVTVYNSNFRKSIKLIKN